MLFTAARIEADGRSASQKLDQRAPSIVWTQTVPLPLSDPCLSARGSVESRGVAVGSDHDVVAVGIVASLSTVVVVKYDVGSGERVWCKSFPITATTATGSTFLVGSAEIRGIAIDSYGTIFIAGHGRTGPSPALTTSKPGPAAPTPALRYFVTKCSFIGTCASAVTFINPPLEDLHNDTIGGIAVGPDGHPVLTGLAEFPSSRTKGTFKLLTVKLRGSTLSLLGVAQASSRAPTAASAQGVAVDSSNDIFVTGTEAWTLKYDSSLSPVPLWTSSLAGSRIATTPRHDAGDDDPGDAQDVGVLRASLNRGFAITKLDSETGATRWTKPYAASLIGTASDLALDLFGNILVAGDQGLVSLSRRGELNWADVLSASSFSVVAVGLDGAPVISGYTEAPGGRTRFMVTLKYDSSDFEILEASAIERSDRRTGPRQNMLAWDEPISVSVKGFLVCINEKTEVVCQDVGSAANLNPRILRSTTPGSLTYEIALSRLTSLKSGKRRISIVAYNDSGESPPSKALFVAGRFGQHTWGHRDDDDRSR
jgi:hypothetical protein